jgi:hypothetical protein
MRRSVGGLLVILLFGTVSSAELVVWCAGQPADYLNERAGIGKPSTVLSFNPRTQLAEPRETGLRPGVAQGRAPGEPLLLLIGGLAALLIATGMKLKLSIKPKAQSPDLELLASEPRPQGEQQLSSLER